MADNGTIAVQPCSVNVPGRTLSITNLLEFPSYAPARGTPLRTGDIRAQSVAVADMSPGKMFRLTESNSYWMSGGSGSNGRAVLPQSGSLDARTDHPGDASSGSTNWPRQIQLGFKFIF
jgi:hypothetical protein